MTTKEKVKLMKKRKKELMAENAKLDKEIAEKEAYRQKLEMRKIAMREIMLFEKRKAYEYLGLDVDYGEDDPDTWD